MTEQIIRHALTATHLQRVGGNRFTLLCLALTVGFVSVMNAMAHGALDERIRVVTAQIGFATNNAQLYLQRAELHREHKDWAAALVDYDRTEMLDARMTRLNFFRARMFSDMGDASKARELLDNYLVANTNDAEALVLRARERAKSGEGQEAVADFSRAIQLTAEPQPELFLERASLLESAGRVEDALSGLDEGIKQLGGAIALQVRALDMDLKRTNYTGALVRVDKILETSPRREVWLEKRGWILLQAGRVKEARDSYVAAEKAIKDLPARLQESAAMRELYLKLEKLLAELDASLKIRPVPAQ